MFNQKLWVFLTRVGMGWFMFYAGITKVMNPDWSAAGYLKNALTFPEFYQSLTSASILPWIDFANQWGLTLLGVSLILGIGVRLSAFLGAALMVLYYFPVLDFPHVPPHAYLVDDHIIYALALMLLGSLRAGRFIGLENWLANRPFVARRPMLRSLLG